MTHDEAREVAGRLTKAQALLLLRIGEGVCDASLVDSTDGDRLYDMGLRSDIRAAGHYFTNQTEAGASVAHILQENRDGE